MNTNYLELAKSDTQNMSEKEIICLIAELYEKSQKSRILLDSLKKVIDYMNECESTHFEECDGEEKLNHIYKDVLILQECIKD